MSHTPIDRPPPSQGVVLPADGTGTEPVPDPQLSGRRRFLGAMFLMATSAIGPGFITQTVAFTDAARGRVRLRDLGVDPLRHRDPAERLAGDRGLRPPCPGPGEQRRCQAPATSSPRSTCCGGLVFNIGNIAGCSLGLNAIFGLDVRVGAAISAVVAMGIFLVRRAGVAMDRVVVLLGVVMIGLTTFVAIKTQPPLGDALAPDGLPGHGQLPGDHHSDRWHRRRLHRLRRCTPTGGQRDQGSAIRPPDHPQLDHGHGDHRRDAGRCCSWPSSAWSPAARSSTR